MKSQMTAIFAAALQAAGRVKSLQILIVCLLPLLSLQPADSSAAPDAKAWRQTGPRLQLSHADPQKEFPPSNTLTYFPLRAEGRFRREEGRDGEKQKQEERWDKESEEGTQN
ncbi:hypothetical protein PAMP_016846 [Pampus punctatissimus]